MARRSKLPEVKDEIIKLIKAGNSFADSCTLVGINESTMYHWLKLGRESKSGKYKQFLEEIRKAEVVAKTRKINIVEKASIDDPKLALELLARKYPKEWGRKQNLDIEANVDSKATIVYIPDVAKGL